MRTRHYTMTLLLVWTLLPYLGHYERGSVRASGEAESNEAISKRRILERLLRLGLAPPDRQPFRLQTSQQHLYPASPETSNAEDQPFRPFDSSLLRWFRSNRIPGSSMYSAEEDNVQSPFLIPSENNSVLVEELSNFFYPMSSVRHSNPSLLRQYDLAEVTEEDSALRRRHAAEEGESATPLSLSELKELSPRELKKLRKLEREKKREEKRKLRNKKKTKTKNKRLEEILKNKDVLIHNIDGDDYIDCCPSELMVVEKLVGKDRNNHAVEVKPTKQYFYERTCSPEVENKECSILANALKKGFKTRCVQQFSYVQAQVRPYRSDVDWHLDYIHVKAGCSCYVNISNITQKTKKKKKNK